MSLVRAYLCDSPAVAGRVRHAPHEHGLAAHVDLQAVPLHAQAQPPAQPNRWATGGQAESADRGEKTQEGQQDCANTLHSTAMCKTGQYTATG